MMFFFSLGASEATRKDLDTSEKNKLEGIGGWLVLVALQMVFGPIRLIVELSTYTTDLAKDGVWEIINTKGSAGYNPQMANLIRLEAAANIALIAAILLAAYLFFNKKRMFPRWYISIAVASLIFIIADLAMFSQIFPGEPLLDPDSSNDLARTSLNAVIWIPYMLMSERVKATFVE